MYYFSIYNVFLYIIKLRIYYKIASCVFTVEENGRVFGRRKVDVIQDNFLISVQSNLNFIKCWLMNTLRNAYRNSASHS